MSSDDVTHEGDMPQQGPGQVLAEARSALAISIEETAEILNLPVRVIKAIEENDADKLPDDVYVYGYIRAYAKLMGLAGDPLIKAWTAHHSEVDPLDSAPTGTGQPIGVPGGIESSEPPKMGRWFAIAMVLSAFFVAFVLTQPEPQEPMIAEDNPVEGVPNPLEMNAADAVLDPPAEGAEVPLEEFVEVIVDEPGLPEMDAAESQPEAQASETIAAEPIAVPEEASEETAEELREEATEKATEEEDMQMSMSVAPAILENAELTETADTEKPAAVELAMAYALPRLTEFGNDEIVMTFDQASWFEIRNQDGVLLFADLGAVGEVRRYIGAAPFVIKLGNAPAVMLEFNGAAVSLSPFTSRSNVANLTLTP